MRQSKFTDAQSVSILKEADADSILESAARFHAGILVMGSRTHGLGSIAARQQGRSGRAGSPISCADVAGGDGSRFVSAPCKDHLGRLLVATDFSSCADAALRYVSGLATGTEGQRVCPARSK